MKWNFHKSMLPHEHVCTSNISIESLNVAILQLIQIFTVLTLDLNIWSAFCHVEIVTNTRYTCVSAFVEIPQSLHCKIFKYTFLGQYPMKSWDFFFLCKIQQPAWLQLSHRKLGPPGMRLFRLLYPKTEKPSFKCDILLWKTLIRVSIEF